MRPCDCDRLPLVEESYSTDYCRLCWLWHNDVSYRQLWGGQVEPGVLEKVIALAGSVARHVVNRGKNVSEKVYQNRLEICLACDYYKDNRCLKCGCFVAGNVLAKARWELESCPLGKWK